MNDRLDMPHPRYHFGPFLLTPATGTLQRHGEPVRIGERALAILTVLVEQAGEVVGKQALLARVWPGAVVDESNLKVNMAALRRALGDAETYVATVNGRGYRFVAGVQSVGPSPAPPAAPAGPQAAHNLPLGTTRIFGRAYAIESLAEDLAQARLVSIVGPGGIGKTTVALAVAERFLGRFPDGVWLVDLAKLKAEGLVPDAIATAVGVGGTSPDRLAAACDVLRDREVLLVLDSCEHVLGEAAHCADRLLADAPGVRILATTREPLLVGPERVRRLPGLTAPPEGQRLHADNVQHYPAVQLFVERAAERLESYRLTDGDAPLVAEICRRLDGMALAIELAATRIDVFGASGLLAQLNDRFPVPAGRRAGPERHRTLAATIDWSIGLLRPDEATFLRTLAVFCGTFDVQAAASVAGMSPQEAAATLRLLADKSLVSTDLAGDDLLYRLLDTTRCHCLERLLAHGELPAARQRHAEHLCAVLERATAEWAQRPAGQWGATYVRVIDDLRAALEWTGAEPRNRGLRIRLTLAGILLWNHFSLTEECRRHVSTAVGELEAAGLAGTAFDMQLRLAFASASMFTEGLKPAAVLALQRALGIAEQLGDIDHRLRCLMMIGIYELFTGEHDAGLRSLEAFVALACAEDPSVLPEGEGHLGIGEMFVGRLQPARQRLEALQRRDLRYFGSYGVRYHADPKVNVGCCLTQVQWLTGAPDTAMRTAAGAIDLAEHTLHHLSLNNILSYACAVYWWNGAFEICERVVTRLEKHVVQHGFVARRPLAAFYRAALDATEPVPTAGQVSRMQRAIEDFERTNHFARMPYYLSVLGDAQRRAGFLHDADATVRRALDLAHEQNEGWCLPEVLRVQAGVLFAQGRVHEAEQRLLRSMARAQAVHALSWRLRAATDLANFQRQRGTALLQAVFDQFTEGFGTQDLRAAAKLLGP